MKSDVSDRRVMDHGTNNSEPTRTGSFSRTSSPGSSVASFQIDDIHSETVSEAGDIGELSVNCFCLV